MKALEWLFGPGPRDGPGYLWPRWLFLRALGLIFFSAFYSLIFQIHGLVGPEGILPAGVYLERLHERVGAIAYWWAPTLFWLGSGSTALSVCCWAGLAASVLVVLNLWPRAALVVCLVTYVSFVSAAQDFSSYQSDGMLLAAGFLCLFFAPPGLRPRLGEEHPPSRASLFLLRWLWFRIYFESGIVKIASHDPRWRHLTALDRYYENGPLPNWVGWYAHQLPHRIHAVTALATLIIELAVVWLIFLPRRWRLLCFCIVTPFQLGIILTSNLAFLNHLVLALGILLLDDEVLTGVARWFYRRPVTSGEIRLAEMRAKLPETYGRKPSLSLLNAAMPAAVSTEGQSLRAGASAILHRFSVVGTALMLTWIFYVTTSLLLLEFLPALPLPMAPVTALEPFRIANQYGLFAVMTTARYEIEFQGSRDGQTWKSYPFRYKPQDPRQPPRFYAPYQPRFDWNLWFASLGPWQQSPFVVHTEELLLTNDHAVLSLFAGNPFPGEPPRFVRAVMWQYWFTDRATKKQSKLWWNRKLLGLYAPEFEIRPDGTSEVVEWPQTVLPPP